MPPADSGPLQLLALGTFLLVLVAPGLLIGWAAGARGWALAGLAPALSFAAFGLAGPWLDLAGLHYTLVTAALAVVVLAAAAYTARCVVTRVRARRDPVTLPVADPPPWRPRAHLAVAACVAFAAAVSMVVVLSASGGVLDTVIQRWDTVFHANGLRYISETGDGGLYGISSVNRYEPGEALFYPNAYHLVGSLVHMITGASIPTVLNASILPAAGILALSLAALVRECGGRPMFAASAAIIAAIATNAVYESIANGLVPFAVSVALLPLGALALQRYLTCPCVETGVVLTLTAAGLLAVHSSALFAAILFALPLLVRRWTPGRFGGRGSSTVALVDLRRLAPVAGAGAALTAPHLIGAVLFAGGDSFVYRPWASQLPLLESLRTLVVLPDSITDPQPLLTMLLLVGLLTIARLRPMRWVVVSAAVFATLFVLVASYGDNPVVIALSRPWWNDQHRLLALTLVPLCLVMAHGLAELQRWLARGLTRGMARSGRGRAAGVSAAAAVLTGLGVATNGFYVPANAQVVAYAYHNAAEHQRDDQPMPVSPLQVAAMRVMADLAEPGEKVLNDRSDGSVWLYAISGVRSVAAHYDAHHPPPDALYLANHFRNYDHDPEVRASVERLGVRHVFVGSGQIHPDYTRSPGLSNLDDADFLDEVYRNPDAVIYEIVDSERS
ncbi:DUF6541 family protein [Haloechinothrix sp. LS1_15]|uniref:DUF6541 family protein n=1 Tax=Haloechinothrix sp. LS1_15 TaxID=2652248 RepID=UPI002944B11E|nr:DUF6541 family protein [Haloechinothrix sp. LS1_15]MDV6012375.1 copper-transporting ATPase [Haloechinothrix sp. LS1_15]